jgi:hypothetical protein
MLGAASQEQWLPLTGRARNSQADSGVAPTTAWNRPMTPQRSPSNAQISKAGSVTILALLMVADIGLWWTAYTLVSWLLGGLISL